MIYWGIDPGLSGAIASLAYDGDLRVIDMPVHVITLGKKTRRKLDLHTLAQLTGLRHPATLCLVEDVHAMPEQGVASSFNFGFTAGGIQGILAARAVPYRLVQPAVWKKHYGLSGDKDASRRVASQRLPQHAHYWQRVKDDGRAEASLLALYARTIDQQQVAA